ncbi:MAG: transcription-repair coupling factor, partial [Treponema sp.]|nr:transcription-repair coupling factor [Treponema sp.]
MKSLSTSINNLLHNWQDFYGAVNNKTDNKLQIWGIHGCLFSFFLQELSAKQKDFLIVVPSENEVNNIVNDLNTVFPQAQVFVFPSWGVIPYRPAAPGSLVFGQRAGFLSKLCTQDDTAPRIFIITERSFISPLPPPEYEKDFTFTLKVNDPLDTLKTAQKLTQLGYTRVSRVNVKGEFSLRGEVLDIFLPLAENPVRIIFDFDMIESIKEFEADSQITLAKKEKITIYPMKEVLWTPELVQTLGKRLEEYQN